MECYALMKKNSSQKSVTFKLPILTPKPTNNNVIKKLTDWILKCDQPIAMEHVNCNVCIRLHADERLSDSRLLNDYCACSWYTIKVVGPVVQKFYSKRSSFVLLCTVESLPKTAKTAR